MSQIISGAVSGAVGVVNRSVEVIRSVRPIVTGTAAATTTIAQETVKKSGGTFGFLGNMWATIGPMLPWVLGLAFIGILAYFVYMLVNKGGSLFKKDYDKEAFKLKMKGLTRNPARVGGGGGWFIAFFTLILLILCVLVQLGLYFLFKMGLSFIPPVIVALVGIFGGLTLTSVAEGFFKSYPAIIDKNRVLVGRMLTAPQISPEGFLDVAMFKRKKWLFFKDVEILSVPLNSSYKVKVKDKKTGKYEVKKVEVVTEKIEGKKTIKTPIPVEDRYKILTDGTLLLNCESLMVTRFYVYPLYGMDSGNVYDFREVVFMRESGLADLNVSLYDVANVFRENAVVIAGSNPWRRLAPEKDKTGEENE